MTAKTANEDDDEFNRHVDAAVKFVTQVFNPATTSSVYTVAKTLASWAKSGSQSNAEPLKVQYGSAWDSSGGTYRPYVNPFNPYHVYPTTSVSTPNVTVTPETGIPSEVTVEGNVREEALLAVIDAQREVIQALNGLVDQLLDTK